jgi:hypothetical protein
VGFAKQWKDNTEGTSKQRKDNGTLWSLDRKWWHGKDWDFQKNEKPQWHKWYAHS